jgi:hypothetical protein
MHQFRNPVDLIDELVFFAPMLLLIPHCAIFRFPARVDYRRKRGNATSGCVGGACGHPFHLMPVPGLSEFIGIP